MLDENKETEFFIEVNWDKNDLKINECKLVKFTFPDGKVAMIKKEYLLSVLFMMGTAEEQMEMVPEEHLTVRWYETVLGIKATKDIQKGEMINVPIKLSLPVGYDETIGKLGSAGGARNKKSNILTH